MSGWWQNQCSLHTTLRSTYLSTWNPWTSPDRDSYTPPRTYQPTTPPFLVGTILRRFTVAGLTLTATMQQLPLAKVSQDISSGTAILLCYKYADAYSTLPERMLLSVYFTLVESDVMSTMWQTLVYPCQNHFYRLETLDRWHKCTSKVPARATYSLSGPLPSYSFITI